MSGGFQRLDEDASAGARHAPPRPQSVPAAGVHPRMVPLEVEGPAGGSGAHHRASAAAAGSHGRHSRSGASHSPRGPPGATRRDTAGGGGGLCTRLTAHEPAGNLAAFWICGLMNNFGYVVMLAAAEDILEGASGIVLAADIVPTLLVKATAPMWTHHVPYRVRITISGIGFVVCFLMVALLDSIFLRLLGIAIGASASGWGEVTFLALCSFYHPDAVSAWSSGTGMAGVGGAGFFLLLHTVIGLSPELTLLLAAPLPLLYIWAYVYLLKPSQTPPASSSPESGDGDGDDDGVSLLVDAPGGILATATPASTMTTPAQTAVRVDDGKGAPGATTQAMTVCERLRVARSLWIYMVPMSIVYFCEYTISTGVNSTLQFPNYHFNRTQFFTAAQFAYQVGVLISRSSGSVFPVNHLWPLAALQALNLVLFVMQSMTQAVGIPWLILVAVLWEGLLGGCLYVNAFRKISAEVKPELREFALGTASVADTSGIVISALVSVYLECALDRYNDMPNENCMM